MAGDWIVWVKGLASRREVAVLASKLGRDRHEIAGRLMVLWEWCDENFSDADIVSETGDVSLFLGDRPTAFVDALLGLPGMAEAMASPEVRWLEARSGGRCVFPNLARHNGTSAKTRAYGRKKKRSQRGGKEDVPELEGHLSPNLGDKIGTTEQKKTKHLIHTAHAPPVSSKIHDLPESLSSPGFEEAWLLWEKYRVDSGHGVVQPITRVQVFSDLAKLGPAEAEKKIRLAIKRQWKHIHLDAEEGNDRSRTGERATNRQAPRTPGLGTPMSAGGGQYEGIKPRIAD